MKRIILTLDYELYGDGSGNVFKDIIEPTERLIFISQKYNIKYTIFVEVVEFWRIQEEWENGNRMGYDVNPIEAVKEQLISAYKKGHDIQLHIHPQWVEAKYLNGKWAVNKADWRLGGYQKEGEYSLENLLRKGKKTLEEWIKPIFPEYECIALRAGGYNIQPSYDIVKVMQKIGLKIDSSIYPGGYEEGCLSNYDYTNIDEHLAYWNIGDKLEECGTSSIIELPIVAFPIVRIKKYLSFERVKSFLRNSGSAKDSFRAKTNSHKRIRDKIAYLFQKEWITWDFCLFSSSLHIKFLNKIEKQDRELFVLVGHPKGFVSDKPLIYLLKFVSKRLKNIRVKDFYSECCIN